MGESSNLRGKGGGPKLTLKQKLKQEYGMKIRATKK